MLVDPKVLARLRAFGIADPRTHFTGKTVQESDLPGLADDRQELDGDRLFPIVRRYRPKPVTEAMWEAHRRYIDVTVTVTGSGDESVTRPAFWDGGRAWNVRFAPTAVGSWRWQTECSDRTNDGLREKSGRLERVSTPTTERSGAGRVSRAVAVPDVPGEPSCEHAKQPPHLRYGFLRLSDNRRYFVHADRYGLPNR